MRPSGTGRVLGWRAERHCTLGVAEKVMGYMELKVALGSLLFFLLQTYHRVGSSLGGHPYCEAQPECLFQTFRGRVEVHNHVWEAVVAVVQGWALEGFADTESLLVGFADWPILAEAELDWEESGRRYTTWNYSALD